MGCLDSEVYLFDSLCCRSGTEGKFGEVDTVFAAGVSSRGVQSINTDQGQNSGRSCLLNISSQIQIFRRVVYDAAHE